jgi:chemotaxis protein MotB
LALNRAFKKKFTKIARNGILICKRSGNEAERNTLSKALNSFEGKDYSRTKKNGKVYVSMENKLL